MVEASILSSSRSTVSQLFVAKDVSVGEVEGI